MPVLLPSLLLLPWEKTVQHTKALWRQRCEVEFPSAFAPTSALFQDVTDGINIWSFWQGNLSQHHITFCRCLGAVKVVMLPWWARTGLDLAIISRITLLPKYTMLPPNFLLIDLKALRKIMIKKKTYTHRHTTNNAVLEDGVQTGEKISYFHELRWVKISSTPLVVFFVWSKITFVHLIVVTI